MTFLNFTFQDPSPIITYSDGQWVEGSPTNDSFFLNYSQGSFKVTSEPGASATFTFLGDSITIYGAKRPNHGNYTVVLDDDEPGFTGDGNGNDIFQLALWNAQNLTYEQHMVTLTNLPTSQGNYLDVDYISIGRKIGPPGYTGPVFNLTIDDASPFFIYNGSWSPSFSSTAVNSSLHSTIEYGASVSLHFQGSSIELYGLYANAPFQVQVDNQLPRALQGPNVDLNEQQQHPKTLLYYMDGLDENKTHIVTLTNAFTNLRVGRPLYIDYAVVWSSQKFSNNSPISDNSPNLNSGSTTSTPNSTLTQSSTSSTTNTEGLSSAGLQSRPFPVAAVVGGVVGGVSGLIIFILLGFVLSHQYSQFFKSKNKVQGNFGPSVMYNEAGRAGITPFVLFRGNEGCTSGLQPPGPGSSAGHHKIPLEERPTQPLDQSTPGPQSHFSSALVTNEILGNPPAQQGQPGNASVTQLYIQESDAGQVMQTSLPPMYNVG